MTTEAKDITFFDELSDLDRAVIVAYDTPRWEQLPEDMRRGSLIHQRELLDKPQGEYTDLLLIGYNLWNRRHHYMQDHPDATVSGFMKIFLQTEIDKIDPTTSSKEL